MFMDSLTTESLELAVMAAKVHFAAAQEHTTHLEKTLARRKEKAEVAR
jgi:hypothetical protein